MTDDHRSPDQGTEHLSLDELADLDEGLLPAERTSTVRAHLHVCELCRARAEAITTTRSALADLPRPTMPDDVRERLADALAAQTPAHDAAEPSTEPDLEASTDAKDPAPAGVEPEDGASQEGVPVPVDVIPAPGTVARRRLGRPTLAASAVAAAIVLAVGAIVAGALNHHQNQQESGAASTTVFNGGPAIAGAQPAHFFQTSTGRNYTLTNLTPDVQGLIARAPQIGPTPATTSSKRDTPPRSGVATGSAGSGGSTAGHGSESTAGSGNSNRHPKPGTATTSTLGVASPPSVTANRLDQQAVPKALQPLARSRAKILECAAFLTGSHNAVPLAVDFGKWTNLSAAPPIDNAPTAVFIFKSTNPSTVAVYVTAPACKSDSLYTYRIVPLPG